MRSTRNRWALLLGLFWAVLGVTPVLAADPAWQERFVLKTNTQGIQAVRFAPDGSTFASSAVDGVIRLWDAGAGKEKTHWQGHRVPVLALAYTPDGKTLLS